MNIEQAKIVFASFYASHVTTVNSCEVSQGFLRDFLTQTSCANSLSEGCRCNTG